jgi:hypothetical protein
LQQEDVIIHNPRIIDRVGNKFKIEFGKDCDSNCQEDNKVMSYDDTAKKNNNDIKNTSSRLITQQNKKPMNIRCDDSDEECNDFINTFIKCDICVNEINSYDKYNRCKNCLSFYHISCCSAKANRSNNKDKEYCEKCSSKSTISEICIICSRSSGSMLKCNNKSWVHYICLSFFSKHFTRLDSNTVSFDRKKNKLADKKESQCVLCKKKSEFVIKCGTCDLNFHPYCGLLFNFEYVIMDGSTKNLNTQQNNTQVICENHLFYKFEEKTVSLSSEKNTCYTTKVDTVKSTEDRKIGSFKLMRSRVKRKIEKKAKAEKVEKLATRTRRIKERSTFIYSLDYKKLKKFEEIRVKKLSHILDKNDWDAFGEYFYSLSQDEINGLTPVLSNYEIPFDKLLEMYEIKSSAISNKLNRQISRVSTNTHQDDKNYCLFRTPSDDEFLAVYDNSSFKNTRSNSNHIKMCKELLYEEINNPEFDLYSNRLNNQNEKNICSKSINIISVELKQESVLKIEIDENDCSMQVDDGECKTNSKIQRHLKLINYQEIFNRDKVTECLRQVCGNELKSYLTSNDINEQSDINYELLLAEAMLNKLTGLNSQLLSQLQNNYKEYINSEQVALLANSAIYIKPYKAILRYGFIKTKIRLGCSDKTIEDLVKYRGGRSGKTRSSEEYQEFFKELESRKEFNESDCCVCMHCDYEDGNTIVFCDACNVGMHPECYGITEIPEGEYYCNQCTNGGLSNTKSCYLCGLSKGAFKPINDKLWGHSFCILLSDVFMFKDYETMDIVIHSTAIDPLISLHECSICKSNKGEVFKCYRCNDYYYHIMCAYQNGNKIEILEKEIICEDYSYPLKVKLCAAIYCDSHFNRDKDIVKNIRDLTYYKEFTGKKTSKF